jgi:hypothetical protein
MKDDEMSGARNTHMRHEKYVQNIIGTPEGKKPLWSSLGG